jgi:competence protein ComEC
MAAVALSFSLGILLARLFTTYAFAGLIAAALLLLAASGLALHRNLEGRSLALGLAALAAAGFLTAAAQRDGVGRDHLRHALPLGEFPLDVPSAFDACVADDGQVRGGESVHTLRLLARRRGEEWSACHGMGILRVTLPTVPDHGREEPPLTRGDRVRGWAVWHRPRNFENPGSEDRVARLARRGVWIEGRTKSVRLLEIEPGGCAGPLTGPVAAARTRVREAFRPLAERGKRVEAAVLASLTIGDYSDLTDPVLGAFRNSGTLHVLVVSGLHVAWIAGLLLGLARRARLPERLRYLVAGTAILAYTCVVGFQASITRCFWVFTLYLLGRMIFRHADPINLLFAAALILLAAHPGWLFEIGFQLSFLSVLAIVMTASPLIEEYWDPVCAPTRHAGDADRLFLRPGRWHRLGRRLRFGIEIIAEGIGDRVSPACARALQWTCRRTAGAVGAAGSMVLLSLAVELWIGPLLARSYNRICWIGPLANVGIVPLSSLTLAAGLGAALAPGVLGDAIVPVAGKSATLLIAGARAAAALPGAWQRCPTPPAAWVWGGIGLLFLWSFLKWRRRWIPPALVTATLLLLAAAPSPLLQSALARFRLRAPLVQPGARGAPPTLSFSFLDVGEGDAIVIRFPDDGLWLLDAGGLVLPPAEEESGAGFDIGEAVVSRYLWHQWLLRPDRVILSHADMDHAGGVPAVLANFPVDAFGYAPAGADARILEKILATAASRGSRVIHVSRGVKLDRGPVRVRVLHPGPESVQAGANDRSLVIRFDFGRFSALLAGDLEKRGERELLAHGFHLQSGLLKVAHHGSRSATSDAFLDAAAPRWAVISAGHRNPFGHPSPEVLQRLERHRARTFVTAELGAVTFETDGTRYAISSHLRGVLERGTL